LRQQGTDGDGIAFHRRLGQAGVAGRLDGGARDSEETDHERGDNQESIPGPSERAAGGVRHTSI
jgi:hypothetical protein